MSGDRVAWLREQVQARLETAKAAAGDSGPSWHCGTGYGAGMIEADGGEIVVYDEGRPSEDEAAHIALNDPRDVTARCEAELAILDACMPDNSTEAALERGDISTEEYVTEEIAGARIVRLLARAYRHREGWEDHWGEEVRQAGG